MKKNLAIFVVLWELVVFVSILIQNAIVGDKPTQKRLILPSFYSLSASITGRVLNADFGKKNLDIFNLFGLIK